MKIKPRVYAETLISVLDEKANLPVIAKNFWNILRKNGQLKDLPEVLTLLDHVYAEKNNMSVAHLISDKELATETIAEVKANLEKKYGQKVLLKVEVNSSILGGMIVKFKDEEFNFSIQNQLHKLNQHLV